MDIWLDELKNISLDTINILESLEIGDNSCIVFNIDNTLFYDNGKIISEIVNIYNYAIKIGIKIFIITDRNGSSQKIIDNTLLELKKNNLNLYDSIYFKKYEKKDNKFKINARKHIVNRGYNIILCVGTDNSDVYGEFTGIPIKIPLYIKS